MNKSANTIRHRAVATRELRQQLNNHHGVVLWYASLSGSGTSTLPHAVEERLFQPGDFIEMYCRCPLNIRENREVKGMYQRAHARDIQNFTGISSPYKELKQPEFIANAGSLPLVQCVDQVIGFLQDHDSISLPQ
jgi:adenylylsulfate kinase-like enzyme